MYPATRRTSAEQAPSQSIEVWSPKAIAWITFFFGLPAGLLLASANWRQLERHDTARNHTIGAVGAFLAYLAAVLLIPGSLGSFVVLAINIGGLLYLRAQTQGDIDEASTRNIWANYRHAGPGVAIGLGMAVANVVVMAILSSLIGGGA